MNQNDIEMAKRLGFGPEALIRAIPSPQQRWKLPVKLWIQELYLERFGSVLGKPRAAAVAAPAEIDMIAYEQELYWDDYHDRNEGVTLSPVKKTEPSTPAPGHDDDLPF